MSIASPIFPVAGQRDASRHGGRQAAFPGWNPPRRRQGPHRPCSPRQARTARRPGAGSHAPPPRNRLRHDRREVRPPGIAEAILYHHERYDGCGYPFGLAGEKIPSPQRIVLVADAFDAITSHRSYQPALSVEFAINEITVNSGTQFDPIVVEAFLSGRRSTPNRRPICSRPKPAAADERSPSP